MLFESLLFYFLLFAFLLPIIIVGIIMLRKTSSIERFELLFPVGSIFGILLFIFSLNITSFFIKGLTGVIFSYLILISLSIIIYLKKGLSKVTFPKGKQALLYIASFAFWGVLLVWKGNYALIGSDTNLYYAVAHTFMKGNFPPMTPWQPDLPLSYHLGVFELLGAFYVLTKLSFNFLHIFFSCFFIFLASQIIIWIWKKHNTIYSFIWGNIAAAILLISFGFFKIIIPVFPIRIQSVTNLHQFFLWVRNLPTVNQSIEVYGAPINLDALIYFIFHALGLATFLSLVVVTIYSGKKIIFEWITLLIGIATLALINESIFIVVFPALIIVKLLWDHIHKGAINWKIILPLFLITFFIISLQSGMITNNLFPKKGLDQSVILFPRKEQIKEDFTSYHYYQQVSKVLEQNSEWLPFNWIHIGLDILILLSVISITFIQFSKEQKIIILTLFLSGIFSLIAYHFIVPKFLVANGNRFLAFSFIFLSLLLIYSFQSLTESLTNRKYNFMKILLIVLAFWIFLPTILPPLALLSKNRFGENKLVPKKEQVSEGIRWIRDNVSFDSRVIVLDIRAPHPSGVARALIQAGVFSPIFPGDFRAYTIEASPEYLDIAYYLSPKTLKELKISILNIDSYFYNTLLPLRKDQLNDKKYFDILFTKKYPNDSWEKVFKIKPEYLELEESPGTFRELVNIHPFLGSIYIDNEENFNPSFLRRALIFSLRKQELYFLPQSGVYLNVEADINSHYPKDNKDYDYLILSKNTNLESICSCTAVLIWKGLRDEVYLWERVE